MSVENLSGPDPAEVNKGNRRSGRFLLTAAGGVGLAIAAALNGSTVEADPTPVPIGSPRPNPTGVPTTTDSEPGNPNTTPQATHPVPRPSETPIIPTTTPTEVVVQPSATATQTATSPARIPVPSATPAIIRVSSLPKTGHGQLNGEVNLNLLAAGVAFGGAGLLGFRLNRQQRRDRAGAK